MIRILFLKKWKQYCTCPKGFLKISRECRNPCLNNPCKQDGKCSFDRNGRTKCDCVAPYFGDFCEKDPCTNNPCKQDGNCSFDKNGKTSCDCVAPYFGDFCEKVLPNSTSSTQGTPTSTDSNTTLPASTTKPSSTSSSGMSTAMKKTFPESSTTVFTTPTVAKPMTPSREPSSTGPTKNRTAGTEEPSSTGPAKNLTVGTDEPSSTGPTKNPTAGTEEPFSTGPTKNPTATAKGTSEMPGTETSTTDRISIRATQTTTKGTTLNSSSTASTQNTRNSVNGSVFVTHKRTSPSDWTSPAVTGNSTLSPHSTSGTVPDNSSLSTGTRPNTTGTATTMATGDSSTETGSLNGTSTVSTATESNGTDSDGNATDMTTNRYSTTNTSDEKSLSTTSSSTSDENSSSTTAKPVRSTSTSTISNKLTSSTTVNPDGRPCKRNPCKNGGTCRESGKEHQICECPFPYGGQFCSDSHWCAVGPGKDLCPLGTCQFDFETQVGSCKCSINERFDYRARECVDMCYPNPCGKGKCEVHDFRVKCRCDDGYGGLNCDEEANAELKESSGAKAALIVLSTLVIPLALLSAYMIYKYRVLRSILTKTNYLNDNSSTLSLDPFISPSRSRLSFQKL